MQVVLRGTNCSAFSLEIVPLHRETKEKLTSKVKRLQLLWPATMGFGVEHLKQTFLFKKFRSLQEGQFLRKYRRDR